MNPELKPLDIHEGILGVLVHAPVLVAVSLRTPGQSQEHLARFFTPADGDPASG